MENRADWKKAINNGAPVKASDESVGLSGAQMDCCGVRDFT